MNPKSPNPPSPITTTTTTTNISVIFNNPIAAITSSSIQRFSINITNLCSWSLFSLFPYLLNNLTSKSPKYPPQPQRTLTHPPPTTTTTTSSRARGPKHRRGGGGGPLFRPYVAKVPWHGGVRAFLSQLFPRYGHYCGPNWSSGKDGGSMLWDQRPIDWLDFCCYCHDIGYDTHDQAALLKADLAFLECLERPRGSDKGDARVAHVYRTMCITGLRNILIPYRKHLVKLQGGQPLIQWFSGLKENSS